MQTPVLKKKTTTKCFTLNSINNHIPLHNEHPSFYTNFFNFHRQRMLCERFWKKDLKVVKVFFTITLLFPLEGEVVNHFIKLKFPLPKNVLCQFKLS